MSQIPAHRYCLERSAVSVLLCAMGDNAAGTRNHAVAALSAWSVGQFRLVSQRRGATGVQMPANPSADPGVAAKRDG
jgi:hypothetical protein